MKRKRAKSATPIPSRQITRTIAGAATDSDGENYADIFERFAHPLTQDAEDEEMMTNMLSLAANAWNIASLQPHERMKSIATFCQRFPEEARLEIKRELSTLITRKDAEFSGNAWLVTDIDLTFHGDEVDVAVEVVCGVTLADLQATKQ